MPCPHNVNLSTTACSSRNRAANQLQRWSGCVLLMAALLAPHPIHAKGKHVRPPPPPATPGKSDQNVPVKSAFGANCEKLLITEIERARSEILVAIYSITRRNITSALVKAAARGVTVRVKYDVKSAEWRGMRQAISYMEKRSVECQAITLTGDYAKMHHKFTVFDRKRVITGSYNYTTSATTANYENLILMESPGIASAFVAEFDAIKNR